MIYSYAEKKRIRKEFGSLPHIVDIPHLLSMQKDSYKNFLQHKVDFNERKNIGLEAALRSIFPIIGNPNYYELHYIKYSLQDPIFEEHECSIRGLTYSCPLRVKLKLIIYDKEKLPNEKIVLSVQEQEVYMGDIPYMTTNGTFIVNGTERVVVSQLHRSPGVFFDNDKGKNHASGKLLFSARIIPYRGSWLELEFDAKDLLYFRIDRRRKLLVSTLLKAMNYNNEDIINLFYKKLSLNIENFVIKTDIHNIIKQGINSPFDIIDDNKEIIIKKNDIIKKKHIKYFEQKKISNISIPESFLINKYLFSNIYCESELLFSANTKIDSYFITKILDKKIDKLQIIQPSVDENFYIANTLSYETTMNSDDAAIEIYKMMRPGEPPTKESAHALFQNLFFNKDKYDFSVVGRLKFNSRLKISSEIEHDAANILNNNDIIETIKNLIKVKDGKDKIDDIDNLGNRRIRAVGEISENQFRIGLMRVERSIKERLSVIDKQNPLPQDFVNAKPINAAIKEFFCSGALSQFMDQDNPLSEITHKRRISALGPGGLSRDRAGFEVRDVHPSHYSRLCPIETPEGPNIGLINSLACYARVNKYGFLEAPYQKVKNSKVTKEIKYLTANEEEQYIIAQVSAKINKNGYLANELIACRYNGESILSSSDKVDYMDVSAKQMVSLASSLIPFLEHDDANRALMGSNMQRQAIPTIIAEKPLVGTGMERIVSRDSGTCVTAKRSGIIKSIDSSRIVVCVEESEDKNQDKSIVDIYNLIKFKRSNKNTCLNQRPIVNPNDHIKKGEIIADGSSTDLGELALGQNLLVAFMPWNGFNFEDSILLSEKIVADERYTSIHIEELLCIARDTKLGSEEITSDIPNVNETALSKLDESGVVYIGAKVFPNDILVGKITPKADQQLTPEEKLLRVIFGEKASDVKDSSLRVPAGMYGSIIDVQIFTREGVSKDFRSLKIEESELIKIKKDLFEEYNISLEVIKNYLITKIISIESLDNKYLKNITKSELENLELEKLLKLNFENKEIIEYINYCKKQKENAKFIFNKKLDSKKKKITQGNDLAPGVLKIVKVFIAVKRQIQPGDKMSGRHGNKGVVSRILPVEDMPYLEDGTSVDIILNPLGVPSRMNIGQILETHMGLASKLLGKKISQILNKNPDYEMLYKNLDTIYNSTGHKKVDLSNFTFNELKILAENLVDGVPIATPIFDGATETDIKNLLSFCNFSTDGKIDLFDGRTSKKFDNKVTIGYMYMLKLDHLVDDKIHARSTGSYSLVTQQPLGGRAQFGGQRFGEMEVWALQAYGAAYSLKEMLTVKSDDVNGRTRMYKNIIDNNLTMESSIPESFNVLMKELRSLALDIDLESENNK